MPTDQPRSLADALAETRRPMGAPSTWERRTGHLGAEQLEQVKTAICDQSISAKHLCRALELIGVEVNESTIRNWRERPPWLR